MNSRKATATLAARFMALALTGGMLVGAASEPPSDGPTYDSEATRTLVEQMLEAHGGYDRWISAPSFQFTAGMYLASLPVGEGRSYFDNWRYYRVTVEPSTSRAFVELPLESTTGSVMAHDGDQLWSREYGFDRSYQDGPFQLLFMHYGFVSLPWLTQQPEVSLRTVEAAKLPGSDVSYPVVEMTFDPQGKRHGGYFRLFIDPDNHRLRGFTQTVSYPYLPGDVIPQNLNGQDGTGGMYRIIDAYVEVDGLVVPRSYATVRVSEGDTALMGSHLVIDPSFTTPLEPHVFDRPEDARVLLRKTAPPSAAYRVRALDGSPPQIDGSVEDAAWRNATWTSGFSTPVHGDPSFDTEFAVLYDTQALYIGIRLLDDSPEDIVRTPGERDDTEGDRIAAFLDLNLDGTTANVFVINAAGVVRDQTSTGNGTQWDNGWNDEQWEVARTIGQDGWTAEFRIPYTTVGASMPTSEEWGFQLTRVVQRLGEATFWRAPSSSGFIGSFGRIQFQP